MTHVKFHLFPMLNLQLHLPSASNMLQLHIEASAFRAKPLNCSENRGQRQIKLRPRITSYPEKCTRVYND